MRDFLIAAPAQAGARVADAGTAIALSLGAAPLQIEFNRIIGLTEIDQLDELRPHYRGAPHWVALDPAVGLDAEVLERGYSSGYAWQKFERGVEPYDARTDLVVEDARHPRDFGDALAGGYGLPAEFASWVEGLVGRRGWHCFVAYDGSTPAGAGALFCAGDVGWFGATATRPEHRGRGAQGAILAARIQRGRELGLTQLVTETGVPRDGVRGPSYRNIVRVGFRASYVRPNYAAPD
jgi:GNAT superfamily N-acetyltransferase